MPMGQSIQRHQSGLENLSRCRLPGSNPAPLLQVSVKEDLLRDLVPVSEVPLRLALTVPREITKRPQGTEDVDGD